MKKSDRKYIILLIASFLFVLALGWMSPQPTDWEKSFQREDSIPYGTAVLFSFLEDLFPGQAVTVSERPPFMAVRDAPPAPSTFLFLTQAFSPDPIEMHALLNYVRSGNTLFVAAEDWGDAVMDSLNIESGYAIGGEVWTDSVEVNFVNPQLATEANFVLPTSLDNFFFSRFDTLNTTVLGADAQERVNFIKMSIDNGQVFLSSLPTAFSNFHMLHQDHARYAASMLSYLPDQGIIWDGYYKPGSVGAQSPLRYILSSYYLKIAYYLLIAGVLIYIALQGKRRQRPIPEIAAPINASAEFVKTVGRLSYQQGHHGEQAKKMQGQFYDYLRTRLGLSLDQSQSVLVRRVASRSGLPREDIEHLFEKLDPFDGAGTLDEKELLEYSGLLEHFYQKTER